MGATFRPPDIIYLVLTATASIALAAWLIDADWVQVFAMAYMACTAVAWALWYRLGLRHQGFRFYYRFFGPICTITVWASFDVDATVNDQKHLDQVYETAKHIIPSARVDAALDNRSVIRVGAQTLTATVATRESRDETEWSDEWGDEDEQQEVVEKSIEIELGGYEGHITGMDDVLDNRVRLLLDGLDDLREKSCPANLSLQAQLTEANPFLVFYLRDVAANQIEDFQMHLRLRHPARDVNVRADAISVTSETPTGLIQAARRHLASPALSY